MKNAPAPETTLVAGRSCDGCTLCCKLAEVKALDKRMGVWCRHCNIGKGCGIYEERPGECRVFYCVYRTEPGIGDIWRPRDCHMAMTFEPNVKRLNVWVDTDFSAIWRNAPYLPQLRQLALNQLRQQGSVIVWEGDNAFAILPDREIALGPAMHKRIVTMGRNGPQGEEYNVEAWEQDDPRLAGVKPRN